MWCCRGYQNKDNLNNDTTTVKPVWILMKQEMIGWLWHQLGHMQITSDRSQVFYSRMLFLMPNGQHQSTEGNSEQCGSVQCLNYCKKLYSLYQL